MSKNNYPNEGHERIDFQRIREFNPLVQYCESQSIELRKTSNRWIGKCPLHNEQNGTAFVIHPDEKWQCYGKCCRQGDVVDLEMLLHGGTLAEAAHRLGGTRFTDLLSSVVSKRPIGPLEIPKLVPTKDNPLALPYLLTLAERQDCQRYSVRLLE